jgi:hypothetical protein
LHGAHNFATCDTDPWWELAATVRTLLGFWGPSVRERTMTEAAGGGRRAEMERGIVRRSLQDDGFRQRLLDDPKGAVEDELGARLPEGVEVRVVEERAQTIYLVLPSGTPIGEGEELSDRAATRRRGL